MTIGDKTMLFGAISAATSAGASGPTPVARPTCCCSSPPTATVSTSRTMAARGWRPSSTNRAAGRARDRPSFAVGRVEELLYWLRLSSGPSRSRRCRYRGQPDGGRRAAVLHPALQRARPRDEIRRARRLRLRHRAHDHRGLGAGVDGARVVERARHRDRGERHGHGRTGPASPRGRPAELEQHGAVRRISVRGHAWTSTVRRREAREDSGSGGAGGGARRTARLHVGARGRRRDHALACGVLSRSNHYLSRPRRACRAQALGSRIHAELGWPIHIAKYWRR